MMIYSRALVTGATSGIGAAFARALPRRTDLLLTARSGDRLEAMRAELAAPGRAVDVLAADLAREEGRQALIGQAEALEIDLLINNAGVGAFGAVVENEPAVEHGIVALNVLAVVDLTRALLPGMIGRAKRAGRRAGLINLSSTLAFQPMPYAATYAASRAFVLAYTEALAAELRGTPVDVLALCPGATRTAFFRRAGFGLGAPPGAADPDSVAQSGLKALGRRTVHVTSLTARAALIPLLAPRALATAGLGMVLDWVHRDVRRPEAGETISGGEHPNDRDLHRTGTGGAAKKRPR